MVGLLIEHKMTKTIVFNKNLRIGELDAEADSNLLDHCFIDNGYIDQLLDEVSAVKSYRNFNNSSINIWRHNMR